MKLQTMPATNCEQKTKYCKKNQKSKLWKPSSITTAVLILISFLVYVMSKLYAPHFPTFFANNLFGMTLQENGIQSNFRNREIVR